MDLYCPRCGEPYDLDVLHEEAELRYNEMYNISHREDYRLDREGSLKRYQPIYNEVAAGFRQNGCGALKLFRATEEPCEPRDSDVALRAQAIYDFLGDDLDGAASLLEDSQWLDS
jgi:hypothetical protein